MIRNLLLPLSDNSRLAVLYLHCEAGDDVTRPHNHTNASCRLEVLHFARGVKALYRALDVQLAHLPFDAHYVILLRKYSKRDGIVADFANAYNLG